MAAALEAANEANDRLVKRDADVARRSAGVDGSWVRVHGVGLWVEDLHRNMQRFRRGLDADVARRSHLTQYIYSCV